MTEKNGAAGAGDGKQEFSLISNDTLLELYRGLLQWRTKGQLGKRRRTVRGNEWIYGAAAVAVAKDLIPDDTVIANDNDLALQIMPFNAKTKNGSAPAFAYELDRALGRALVQKTSKSARITVVFGGEDHGQVWTDVLEIARAHRLPIVFVSELREKEGPLTRGARKPNSDELEPGTELARIIVDGHDAVASYRVAHEAIERARKDRGPTLIECTAFRLPGQRPPDSLGGMENYLRGKGLLQRGMRKVMLGQIERKAKLLKR